MAKGINRPERWPVGFDKDQRDGIYRMRVGGRTISLRTRNEDEALAHFAELARRAGPKGEDFGFAGYCRRFCEQVLPNLRALKGAHKGKPLSPDTIQQYRQYLLNKEIGATGSPLCIPLQSVTTMKLRQYLSRYSTTPTAYNRALESFSRCLRHALDEGQIEGNPARDVSRQVVATKPLPENAHALAARIMDELHYEWQRVAFSLLYLLGCRPGELVALRDADISEERVIRTALKTGDRVGIRMDEELTRHIEWLRNWKREQELISPLLLCHPRLVREARNNRGMMRRNPHAGKPLPRRAMTDWWAEARARAGVREDLTVGDLRPLGLTDEAEARDGQPTLKGGQRSESIRRRYVKRGLVSDERNSLTGLWAGDDPRPEKVVALRGERAAGNKTT